MTPLLARLTSADRQFERIYERHAAEVYRYALVVLRNPHDAEDVTQTTFMNAYRSMQGGERPESPKNWLIAIAHNVCRQRFRQAQRRPQESTLYEESIVEEPEDPKYSAEDIQRALGQLAFNQRAALTMRELEGRGYAEIADVMGLTVSAVETVIFRARRALREQLETSVTCDEAERSLSRQLDGELPRADRGPLRAHLRECPDCAQLARSQRASRGALKALLGGIPVPASFLGGSGATLGLAAKAAVVICAGAVVGTGSYEVHHVISAKSVPHVAESSSSKPAALADRAVSHGAPVVAARHLATRHLATRHLATRHLATPPRTLVRHPRAAVKTQPRAQGNAHRSIVAAANVHRLAAATKVAAHRAAIELAKVARAQRKLAKRQQRVNHVKAVRHVKARTNPHHPAAKRRK